MQSAAERMLSLHPIGVVVLWLVANAAALPIPGALIGIVAGLLYFAWPLSLRLVAGRVLAQKKGVTPSRPWAFIVGFVGAAALAMAIAFGLPRQGLIAGLLVAPTALGMFVGMWTAADALEQIEGHKPHSRHTVGTALLIFYLPIGIWFLRPRVRQLLAATGHVTEP